MVPLLLFIAYVLHLYEYVVIAAVVLSWLIGFNVINSHNGFVRAFWQAITAVTEPLLKPIRGDAAEPGRPRLVADRPAARDPVLGALGGDLRLDDPGAALIGGTPRGALAMGPATACCSTSA